MANKKPDLFEIIAKSAEEAAEEEAKSELIGYIRGAAIVLIVAAIIIYFL